MTCLCELQGGKVVSACAAHEALIQDRLADQIRQIDSVKARLVAPFDWNKFHADTFSKDGCVLYDATGRRVARVRSLHPSYENRRLVSVGLQADMLLLELGAPKP